MSIHFSIILIEKETPIFFFSVFVLSRVKKKSYIATRGSGHFLKLYLDTAKFLLRGRAVGIKSFIDFNTNNFQKKEHSRRLVWMYIILLITVNIQNGV